MAHQLIDIRHECLTQNLRKSLAQSLLKKEPTIPSLLLWNERGLNLFNEMTDYGLMNSYGKRTEVDILQTYMHHITSIIGDCGIVIDLGAG